MFGMIILVVWFMKERCENTAIGALRMVHDGAVDVLMADTVMTHDRLQRINFSYPLYNAELVIVSMVCAAKHK